MAQNALSWLFGDSGGVTTKSNFTKPQKEFFNDFLQQLQGQGNQGNQMGLEYLMSLLDPNSSAYNAMEDQAMNQFNEEIIPGISEKFAGMGALGSSGFGQALGGASRGLSTQLAAMRAALQGGAAGQLTNLYNQRAGMALSTEPFSFINRQGGTGVLGGALQAFAGGMGQSMGSGGGGGGSFMGAGGA